MEIGDRLLVVPEWLREDPKVRSGLAAGRVPILGAGVLNQTVLYQFFAGLNPFLVRY